VCGNPLNSPSERVSSNFGSGLTLINGKPGDNISDAVMSLRLVLQLERVACLAQ